MVEHDEDMELELRKIEALENGAKALERIANRLDEWSRYSRRDQQQVLSIRGALDTFEHNGRRK